MPTPGPLPLELDYTELKANMRNAYTFFNSPAGTVNLNLVGNDNRTLAELSAQMMSIAGQYANVQIEEVYSDLVNPSTYPALAYTLRDEGPNLAGFYEKLSSGASWTRRDVQPATEEMVDAMSLRLLAMEQKTQSIYTVNNDKWGFAVTGRRPDGKVGVTLGVDLLTSKVYAPGGIDSPGIPFSQQIPGANWVLVYRDPVSKKALIGWATDGSRWQPIGGVWTKVFDPSSSAASRARGVLGGGYGQIADMADSIVNPFRDFKLVGVGDSNMWGLQTNGSGVSQPRNHSLNDPRNNENANNWMNKFRNWVCKTFTHMQADDEYTMVQPGSYSWSETVETNLVTSGRVSLRNSAGIVIDKRRNNYTFDVTRYGSTMVVPTGCAAEFVGQSYGFRLYYGTTSVAGAVFQVFQDEELLVTQPFFSETPGFGNYIDVVTTPGRSTIRIVNNSPTGDFEIEGYEREKTWRVTNNGIIGTNSNEWRPDRGLIAGAVKVDDTAALYALGANDRGGTASSSPTGWVSNYADRTKQNALLTVKYLEGRGIPCSLVTLPRKKPTADYPITEAKYGAVDIRRVYFELKNEYQIDVIDPYPEFSRQLEEGVVLYPDGTIPITNEGGTTSYPSDPTHYWDAGHEIVFQSLKALVSGAF